MVEVQDNLKIQQKYIAQLLKQVDEKYQELQPEIQQISEEYSGFDEEFSFVEEFELLIVDICGYAKQVQTQGRVSQGNGVIAHLQAIRVFTTSAIAQFYTTSALQDPKVKAYLQMLDYLRLLTLEFLQMQQTAELLSV